MDLMKYAQSMRIMYIILKEGKRQLYTVKISNGNHTTFNIKQIVSLVNQGITIENAQLCRRKRQDGSCEYYIKKNKGSNIKEVDYETLKRKKLNPGDNGVKTDKQYTNIDKAKKFIKKQRFLGLVQFDFIYDYDNDKVYIDKVIDTTQKTIEIPSFVQLDKQVSEHPEIFRGCTCEEVIIHNVPSDTPNVQFENLFARISQQKLVIRMDHPECIGETAFGAFQDSRSLEELDLSNLTFRNTKNLQAMFKLCKNLRKVEFGKCFEGCKPKVTTSMFSGCGLLSVDLQILDTSEVFDAQYMFHNTGFKTLDFQKTDFSQLKYASNMFQHSGFVKVDLQKCKISKLEDATSMFNRGTNLKKINIRNVRTSTIVKFNNMFKDCTNLEIIEQDAIDMSQAISATNMFQNCAISQLDAPIINSYKLIDAEQMFCGMPNIRHIDLRNFQFNSIQNAKNMFKDSENLVDIGIRELVFESDKFELIVFGMFQNTSIQDIKIQTTKPITCFSLNAMFNEWHGRNADLQNFRVTGVKEMSWMFLEQDAVNIDLTGPDLTMLMTLSIQFRNCKQLRSLQMPKEKYGEYIIQMDGILGGVPENADIDFGGMTLIKENYKNKDVCMLKQVYDKLKCTPETKEIIRTKVL